MNKANEGRSRGQGIIKSVVRLGLAALLVGGLAGCGDDGVTAEDHLQRARAHIAENAYPTAVIELKNAVQKDPDLAEARLVLAETYLLLGDNAGAEKEFIRAEELGADSERVLLALADARLGLGRFDDVLDAVADDTTAAPARRASLLLIRAKAHFGLGDAEDGERALAEAHELDPNNARVLALMAGLAQSRDDGDAARDLIAEAKAIAPTDPEVLARAGGLAAARGDTARAVAEYQALVDSVPGNPRFVLLLAEAQVNSGDIDAAIATLDPFLKRYPNQPYASYLRGLAAYQKQDFEAAKTFAQPMIQAAPTHLPTLMVLGGAHFALGEDEQAINRLTVVNSRAPNNVAARRMLGAALLRNGDARQAREVLAPLEAGSADDAALLAMIGTAALRSGDLAGGERYFERLTELQPENPAARAQLGTIRVGLGEVEEGTLDLEQAIEQDPNLRSLAVLAVTHIQAREFDKALEVAERISREFPESPIGATLSGIAHAGKDDVEAARAAFERALEIDPATVDASMNLAALKVRENDLEAARDILAAAAAETPDNPRLLGRLANIEAQLGDFKAAERHLLALGALDPEAIGPKILLARLHVRTGEPRRALDLVAGQVPLHPDNAGLLDVVAEAYRASGETEKAARTYERLLALTPDNAPAHLQLALAYEQLGQRDKAESQLEKLLAVQPESALAKIGLARIALAEGDTARAGTFVDELAQTPAASDPRFLELKGDVALRSDDPATAVAAYEQAYNAQQTTQRVLKLAQARKIAGESDPERVVVDWLAQNPQDTAARLYIANEDIRARRFAAAREHYERAVEEAPDNALVRNNLAWLLWHDGEARAALPHAGRALELAPDAPGVKDTAGIIHLELGNVGRASALLAEAAAALPDNAEVQYHYAQALIAQDQAEQARGVLRRALASGTDFPERAEAESLLERLGG